MLEKSCSAYFLERRKIGDGSSFIGPALPFMVAPSLHKRSFLSDNLVDPEAPAIRAALPDLPVPFVAPASSVAARAMSRKRKGKRPATGGKTKKAHVVESVPSSPEAVSHAGQSLGVSVGGEENPTHSVTSGHTPSLSPRTAVAGFVTPPGSERAGAPLVQEQFLSTEDLLCDDVNLSASGFNPDPSTPVFTNPPMDSQKIVPVVAPKLLREVDKTILDVGDIGKGVVGSTSGPNEEALSGEDGSPFARSVFSDDLALPEATTVRSVSEIATSGQIYVPEWDVKCSDDLNDFDVCRHVIDHIAPPATVLRIQGTGSRGLASEITQALAQAAALTSEGLHRWSHSRDVARASGNRIRQLVKRVEVREAEIDLLEKKLASVIAQKKRNFSKYKDLLHDNTELKNVITVMTVEFDQMKEKIAKVAAEPALNVEQIAAQNESFATAVRRAEKAEQELELMKKERAEHAEALEKIQGEKEKLVADKTWLVSTGLKEFIHTLMGSSEYLGARAELCNLARRAGYTEGVKEGHRSAKIKIPLQSVMSYDPRAPELFDAALGSIAPVSFPYLEELAANAGQSLDVLREIRPKSPVEE